MNTQAKDIIESLHRIEEAVLQLEDSELRAKSLLIKERLKKLGNVIDGEMQISEDAELCLSFSEMIFDDLIEEFPSGSYVVMLQKPSGNTEFADRGAIVMRLATILKHYLDFPSENSEGCDVCC